MSMESFPQSPQQEEIVESVNKPKPEIKVETVETLEQWEAKLNTGEREIYNKTVETAQKLSQITGKIPHEKVEAISSYAGAFQFPRSGGKTEIQGYFEYRINSMRDPAYFYRKDIVGNLNRLQADLDILYERVDGFIKSHPDINKNNEKQESIKLSDLEKSQKAMLTTESGNRYLISYDGKEWVISSERDKQHGTILNGHDLNKEIKKGEPFSFGNGSRTSNIVKCEVLAPTSEKMSILTNIELQKEMDAYDTRHRGEKADLSNVFKSLPIDDDPDQLLFRNNGFKEGDNVVFFADGKERNGTLKKNTRGQLTIVDKRNNPWYATGILNEAGSYIKKA